MAATAAQVSTGLSGLDRVFRASANPPALIDPERLVIETHGAVIDWSNAQCQAVLRLNANTLKQNVFCYLDAP